MAFTLANVAGRAVLVDGQNWYDLQSVSDGSLGPDPMAAVASHTDLHGITVGLATVEADGNVDATVFGAPVPAPRNSFAVGLNYKSHIEEANAEQSDVPLIFTKFPSCIVGPTADVELRSGAADYEAEVVVVIGTGGRDIPVADAWNHVAGVTVGQDISDRRLQFVAKPPHFDLGKSRDTYGPIGPVLVSVDQLADRDAIPIMCSINGEQRQSSDTSQLIFDVPTIVAYLSEIITLAPGDLIFTGTPEGIGAMNGVFLAPGDVIITTIDGVGTMTNTCV